VKYLAEHETNINKKNNSDATLLFDACSSGNLNIIKYFVEHGVYINKTNDKGTTPLIFCFVVKDLKQ